jgi:hypothetical protein
MNDALFEDQSSLLLPPINSAHTCLDFSDAHEREPQRCPEEDDGPQRPALLGNATSERAGARPR